MADDATYLQIASDIRAKIHAGAEGYRPGDKLPSEDAMLASYNVARATARQAIARLRQEGLVTTVQGSGTRVRRTPPVRRLSTDRFAKAKREQGRGAYDVEMRAMGFQGRNRWLELGRAECPADAAELLQVEPGAPAMVRARQMFAAPLDAEGKVDYDAEEVMQVATSYIPWDLAEAAGVTGEDTGAGGLYSRLEDVGRGPDHFVEKVVVRVGTDEECDLLKLDGASLVLTLDRQAFDAEGQVVEICRHVMPPTYYEITYEFPAG